MPSYGTYQRAKPRVEVLRGYDPNLPTTFTEHAPVASGVVILSGQVISQDWNSGDSLYEWILGGGGSSGIPFIALQDSADGDVVECGKLTGLSCLGKFVIQTPYYKTGDVFNAGVPVSFDGTTGNIKATTLQSGAVILGYVAHGMRGALDISATDSSAVAPVTVVKFSTAYSLNPVNAS